MKRKKQHLQSFVMNKTGAKLAQDRRDDMSAIRSNKKHGIVKMIQWVKEQDWKEAHPVIAVRPQIIHAAHRTQARRRHGEGSRSSAASGDGNSNSDDPDPERPLLQNYLNLFDQASLAVALCISKKSVQNIFSKTHWLLPPAICIPGARGPRWTLASVQTWLADRPAHTVKPAPKAASRKVGRPRIALATTARSAGKVGAA